MQPGTVLHVSPHPDDEVLGAPATLMSLRDAGWRIVNLACSLGRPEDRARRAAELEDACRRARFELMIPSELPALGARDDPGVAQRRVAAEVRRVLESSGARMIVGPAEQDGHHGHAIVGRAIVHALEANGAATDRPDAIHVMFWSLWRDLAEPNLLVPFGRGRLAEIRNALAAHTGELARNRFERLLEGRAMMNAVVGPERVFGFGGPGISEDYAELLRDVVWSPAGGWRPAPPRVFDPAAPFG